MIEVLLITDIHRADLEDQHAISDEISQALTQGPTSTAVDEDELEEELSALQQEDLDEKMLKTGTVPVADQVHGLPNAVRGECESFAAFSISFPCLLRAKMLSLSLGFGSLLFKASNADLPHSTELVTEQAICH